MPPKYLILCEFDPDKNKQTGPEWLYTPVIPATWEAEMGGLWSEASQGKIVSKTLFSKISLL
jgi:hypothetical protein